MNKLYILLSFVAVNMWSQNWQQKADYVMDIDMDVKTHQYKGKQKITYKNNAPETLTKVYYHLYNNAFQPGSDMDVRIETIKDPDPRVMNNIGTKDLPVYKSKIATLKPEEQGFIKIVSLKQNKKPLQYKVQGTILEVELNQPIKSGRKAKLEMEFIGQVPLQVRRSGRNSKEGVAYSMTQWYPKLAAYDDEGWHANEYIGREFYADWGDYDVTIHIDKNYTVGGTGYLQKPETVGHGYEKEDQKLKLPKGEKLTWRFKAPNVHDFSWAADTEYKHIKHQIKNGPMVHFLYKQSLAEEKRASWEKLPAIMDTLFDFYNTNVGKYPYKQYSVIQGGDGGMEYAMCTLITGDRGYRSLVGVIAHELAHSWFQFLLATNETKHAWMDEGFTTYISTLIENKIFETENGFKPLYDGYFRLLGYGIEEPLTTFADCFEYNYGYGISSYDKGAMFLHQLSAIIGQENLMKSLQLYFKDFHFKHPKPYDFIRSAEKVSDLELDWYLHYWTFTTKTIDYGVEKVEDKEITLSNFGTMPMPLDVEVTYTDGSIENFNIPLAMMRGEKTTEVKILKDWSWVNPTYTFKVGKSVQKIKIDPLNLLADVNSVNNIWEK